MPGSASLRSASRHTRRSPSPAATTVSVRSTRQNTSRPGIPPLGRPIVPLLTYDIFDTLRLQNRIGRRRPTADQGSDSEDTFDSLAHSSSDSSDSDDADRDSEIEELLDPDIRGTETQDSPGGRILQERKEQLRPAIEARAATSAYKAAKKAYPKDRTPKQLLGPNAVFPFQLVEWHGQEVLPVVDRVDFVIAAAGGVLQEFDAATVLQQANTVFAQAAQTARTRQLDISLPFRLGGAFAIASSQADALFAAHPSLRRPFIGPWTSWRFDLGPQTVTPPQHSPNDIPWWWIAITALGDFDADTGGHLILWEPRIPLTVDARGHLVQTVADYLHARAFEDERAASRHSQRVRVEGYGFQYIQHAGRKVRRLRASARDLRAMADSYSSPSVSRARTRIPVVRQGFAPAVARLSHARRCG
ncbi:hypothetical protein B0H13DRAFT_1915347 [Mycena leptocephala]|nr:hypothetical protein B0H13DRAFT_1915347 [Mycena leptocephala]